MKKVFAVFLSFILLFTVIPLGFNVSAASDGYYTYTVSDNAATITDVDVNIYKDVTIPSMLGGYTVTKIGRDAFEGCENLENIILPENLTTIDAYAFYCCKGLKSITFSDKVTKIEISAFFGCESLKDVYYNSSYKNKAENIDIRSKNDELISAIWHYSVEENLAYEYDETELTATLIGCSELVAGSIVIPTSVTKNEKEYTVTKIGEKSFQARKNIESVTIPDSITYIGEYAFYNCGKLKTVNLGYNVKEIDYYAFASCSSLEDVYYNASYKYRTENLPSGNISGDLQTAMWHYAVEDDLIYEYDEVNLTATVLECNDCATNITIPSTVSKNGKEYTVKTIGNSAFFRLTKLKSITIADSVTEIESAAFSGCTGLENVALGSGVQTVGNMAFYNCTNLENITLGKNIVSLGKNVFRYSNAVCYSYKNSYAAKYCLENSLPYIYIDSTEAENILSGKTGGFNWNLNKKTGFLTLTGSGAMSDFSSEGAPWYDYRLYVSSVKLPDEITKIGNNAFENFVHLKSVNIVDNITVIGNSAFTSCAKLKSITIPEGVVSIGDSAFKDCTGLTTFNYNAINCDFMGKYGRSALAGCTNIENVTIGNNVRVIPDYAFKDCKYVSSINLPSGVKSIGEGVFEGCISLTSVNVPNGVTDISDHTFSGCEKLESVILPESIKSIGKSAFAKCYSLTSVNLPSSVTSIGFSAFDYCNKLNNVIIPKGVTSIEEYTFFHCASLENIVIPDSVKSIGNDAFGYCSMLENITIPNGVTELGEYVFSYCSKLQEIVIPSKVEVINGSAFKNCDNLKSITVYNPECTFYTTCGIDERHVIYGFKGSTAEDFAQKVGAEFIDVETVHTHNFNEATCTEPEICPVCGKTQGESLGHTYTDVCDDDCDVCFEKRYPPHKYQNECDTSCDICGTERTVFHSFDNSCDTTCNLCSFKRTVAPHLRIINITPATTSKDGKAVKKCVYCDGISSQREIKKIKSFALTTSTYLYNGKVRTPGIVIKDSAGKRLDSKFYTVFYSSGRKNVGEYKVTVKLKGDYSGSKTLYFKIVPPKSKVTSVAAGKKSFTAKVSKKSTQVTGYQIQYATNKNFTGASCKTVSNYTSVKHTFKNLKAKKTYYVRVRTFKRVGDKVYYSPYSAYKTVKTK